MVLYTSMQGSHFLRYREQVGRYLARGMPAKIYEAGLNQRTVIIEFDTVAQAIAAHDSPAYQAALSALGNAAKRDVRVIEGLTSRIRVAFATT